MDQPGEGITRRERQIAEAYANGASHREIATELNIAPTTVRKHVSSVYAKLGVTSKVALLKHMNGHGRLAETGDTEAKRGHRGNPRLYIVPLEGATDEERAVGAEVSAEICGRLGRLAGIDVSQDQSSARYILQGNLRLGANEARVWIRGVDAVSGVQTWADRIDIEARDRVALVDLCGARISASIRWRATMAYTSLIAARDTSDLNVEQIVMLSGVRSRVFTRESWMEGGRIAETALQIAPDNFMALAMSSFALGLVESLLGYRETPQFVFDLAMQRVEAAVIMNNESAMAHTTRSLLILYANRQHEAAMALAQHAIEIDRYYAPAHWALGAARVFAGQWTAGIESAQLAFSIDPNDPYRHLYLRVAGLGYLGAGQLDEAADAFRRCDRLVPALPPNLAGLAVASALQGDLDAAHRAVAELQKAEPGCTVSDFSPLPYKCPDDWNRFVRGLRIAGLPE